MGMFDEIEVVRDVENGPSSGSYQTKDLDCMIDYYVLDSNRLYKKIIEYELVPEEERKHPVFGMFRSKFKGLVDTQYHGYIEMYDAVSTWKLKFTDGDLVQSTMTEFISQNIKNESSTSEPSDWSGDDRVYEYEPEEYEG